MCFILIQQIALASALRVTLRRPHRRSEQVSVPEPISVSSPSCSGFCFSFMPSSSGIFPRHPDSSFILASNFCACPLPQAFCILCSSPQIALSEILGLSLACTHLSIPVSYFENQPELLPAAPLGRDHPAIAVKKCFAIKMDDLLFIMCCF